ncbi:hypothetical protein ACFP1Z_16635 [Streptomyces gamaensis]|uniref:DUF7848 domain-containing protein n=1 Tax=Streptomyces gamaensis TaxID=1763542 RepID=A0ABW0Z5W2_9ACTN
MSGAPAARTGRTVIRPMYWTLLPDREPDAEPTVFAMECVVCGETSAPGEEFVPAQEWTLRHAGRHPSHLTYREVVQRPWRAFMH